MRVLVIEDDPMIGRAVVAGLQEGGYTVDWVRDGGEAELALANGVYDLALLDLALPRRDGLEILKGLRRSGNKLPVVIITARDSVADRVTGLDNGADDYLVKPFDLD
ncbi:MAG TPA: response regulator, partial [Burkholderiales bacterium]|nr:response regulator [Burkholderiales bacterium]